VADSYIPFWNVGNTVAASPDLKFDAEQVTVGANAVLRERVEVAGSGASEIARVLNTTPGGSEYALVTRNIPSGTQPVSAASLPLPTGAATQATLAAIQTAVEGTLDVAGTVSSTVHAGAKGGTAAADVTSSVVDADHQALDVFIRGGAAAGVQYTEGDVDASITGTAMLWEDTGDTLRAVSAAKPLPVNIVAGAGAGGTSIVDDAVFTPATSAITPAGGIYRSSRDLVDDGDAGAFAMSQRRALVTTLESIAGQAVNVATLPNPDWTLGGLQVAVHGVIAGDTTFGGTEYGLPLFGKRHDANTSLATSDGRFAPFQMDSNGNLKVNVIAGSTAGTQFAEDTAHASGDSGTLSLAVRVGDTLAALAGTDGDYIPFATDASGSLWVTLSTMAQVIGSVAHDSADTEFPVKIGGRANSALRTPVADNDRTDAFFDDEGALVSRKAVGSTLVDGNASNTDGTSTQVIAAQTAGVRTYLCDVEVTNTHATQFAYVELKDGTTVRATLPVPPSGGVVKHFDPPLRGSAATAWNFDPSAATTTLICSMSGYVSKS
jgi:hypothetical protein